MTVQYIEKNGRREYAIVPIDEYERLVAAAEMADDGLAIFECALVDGCFLELLGDRQIGPVAGEIVADRGCQDERRQQQGLERDAAFCIGIIGLRPQPVAPQGQDHDDPSDPEQR